MIKIGVLALQGDYLEHQRILQILGINSTYIKTPEELTKAIKISCEDQQKGITTFIEVILNQELGEPFIRDAMKKPVEVAGINSSDMQNK